ncbi:lipoprotein [Klebsiella quasipneumoniae]|nr:lipoprotein [Klebsiella quasipneumoniae]
MSFYTDKRYFNDPSLFDRLKINQPLHLGARRLDNGSYWIHWLSDGETLLEPDRQTKRWARPLLFISLLTLIVTLIPLLVSASEWGRFGCGIIAILAFIALLTGLYERLFHPALKRHPAMRDLLAKMALARRCDVSFCQPLTATTQALRHSAMPFTQALPERYAAQAEIITDTHFKKWYAGNPTREYHGLGIQCSSLPLAFWWQAGCANFALHPVFYRRQPPFLATGDRILAVYERDSRAIHALYNASDGAAYIKNHPLYPGRRQLSLLYYLFYGLALVMYLLFLGVELVSALQSGRRVWWQVQDSLDMLSLLLLCFGGVLAVLELIGPTAWLLSHRVADWLKLRSAMRRYLRGAAPPTTLEEVM